MALTLKQQRFVDEYLIDLNATQAAIRTGYSEKTAYAQGQRLLKNVEIQTAIEKANKTRSEKAGATAERVLEELSRVGFSDLRKAFTPGGALLHPGEWDDDFASAVSSVEVVSRPTGEKDDMDRPIVEHVHKLKLWDKNSALEKIAKHLGMFIERHEHSGPNGNPINMNWGALDTDTLRKIHQARVADEGPDAS